MAGLGVEPTVAFIWIIPVLPLVVAFQRAARRGFRHRHGLPVKIQEQEENGSLRTGIDHCCVFKAMIFGKGDFESSDVVTHSEHVAVNYSAHGI